VINFERAHWPDVREAIRRARAGEPVDFDLALLRYLAVPPPSVPAAAALDVCCGSGQGALILKELGYSVAAFDRDPSAAELLRGAGVEFRAGDFYAVQYPPIFTLVTMCDCLEHLPRPAEALKRARSWLLPSGRLWLAVPLEGTIAERRSTYHCNAWDRKGLLKLLAETGWTIERETAGRPGTSLFWGLLK